MAATTSGALKAYLESLGMGLQWYRDGAPKGTKMPYGVITEDIGSTEEAFGDFGDPNADVPVQELVQLDLYELARSGPSAGGATPVAESYTARDTISRRLRGVRLPAIAGRRVYGVKVQTRQRFPITDNVVRTSWTLLVWRDQIAPGG